MVSIDKEYSSEYIIQKSRFLSFAYPVFDESKCKDILDNARKKFSDATHVCFAYILSSPRVEKCSDDGEPVGTAGKPIIELLKKKKLENILVIVVRYFGGIKLGAGGLVRAYTNSANMSLNDCKVIEFYEVNKYRVEISHDMSSKFLNALENSKIKVINIEYCEKVKIEFLCENVENLKNIFYDTCFIGIGKEIVCR
jgi:uncharacterized YigZ family protein